MNVPLLSVYHVATFYKAFSLTPRGKHVVRVCQGTACHVRGAPRVLDALKSELKIQPGKPRRTANSPWKRSIAWELARWPR